ncbi:MAG: ectoine/hydroxyectoine ABC transporter permease subunit EhuC [Carbonactinosporaceae bacterium]
MEGFVSGFLDFLPTLWEGILYTLVLTVLGAALSLLLSFVFGLMALSPAMWVRFVSRVVVEFFRGTSLLVQLFWLFFVLPFFGVQLIPIATGVVALGLNYGAYGSEVVRGAINAVPRAQWEATVALNMGRAQRMRRVILPQAIVGMIPPFGNWLIQLLKGSALVSAIGLTDITFEALKYRSATGDTIVAFGAALIVYFILAQLCAFGMRLLERRAKRGIGQQPEGGLLGSTLDRFRGMEVT